MTDKCPECKDAAYKIVDEETDVKGRRFALLECPKCRRTVIVPAKEAQGLAKA